MNPPTPASDRFVTVAYGPRDDDLAVIALAAELAAARGARIVAVRIGGDVPEGRFAAELHTHEVDRLRRAARGVPLTAVVWPSSRPLRDLEDLARRSGTGVLVHAAGLEASRAHRGAPCPVVRAYPASPPPSAGYAPHSLAVSTVIRDAGASPHPVRP